ncbi:expressed unknown protein [Seminavis robusta]|uniref:Uncharacterized protein n=1 Tax=Seminavis robusta TaxID=568900 RepID=A0A9N8E581_9STRA|nr:expressed unknown protein [Seminavis robusta]|eukprot:Sro513_g157730.1 n/a (171) ;mRNA; f:7237-7749
MPPLNRRGSLDALLTKDKMHERKTAMLRRSAPSYAPSVYTDQSSVTFKTSDDSTVMSAASMSTCSIPSQICLDKDEPPKPKRGSSRWDSIPTKADRGLGSADDLRHDSSHGSSCSKGKLDKKLERLNRNKKTGPMKPPPRRSNSSGSERTPTRPLTDFLQSSRSSSRRRT